MSRELTELLSAMEAQTSRLGGRAGAKSLLGLLQRTRRAAEAKQREAQARQMQAQANRARNRPLGLYVGPGGAIFDAAEQRIEAQREQARLSSLRAERQAAVDERTPEVQARLEHDAAREEEFRRHTPPGIPT